MTREESIKILKEERWYMSRYSEEYKEAYDMAIEALSKPNYETDTEVILMVTNRKKEKVILWDSFGEVEYVPSADALLKQEIDFHKEVSRIEAEKVVDLEHKLADMESVVRCKDCKWYMLTDHNETEVCTNKQWDISMAVYPIISANGFCSYGERGDNSYGERAEQTEYKLPGHDEVMDALDKLTLKPKKESEEDV